MIDLSFKEKQVVLGETVSGQLTWIPEKESAPRAVLVSLQWRTEGRGDKDSHVYDTITQQTETVLSGSGVTVPFSFVIPQEGPPSYDGTLIRIIWEVAIRVDIPWARDIRAAFPFRVLLRKKEESDGSF